MLLTAILYGAVLASFCTTLEATAILSSRIARIGDREHATVLALISTIGAIIFAALLRPRIGQLAPEHLIIPTPIALAFTALNHWRWRRRIRQATGDRP